MLGGEVLDFVIFCCCLVGVFGLFEDSDEV